MSNNNIKAFKTPLRVFDEETTQEEGFSICALTAYGEYDGYYAQFSIYDQAEFAAKAINSYDESQATIIEQADKITELEANQVECLEMLNNFHKNTGSLGAKSLVDKILKQAEDS